MAAVLIGREGKRQFTVEIKKERTFIGRDPGVDIVVNDSTTSRRHAVIVAGTDSTFQVRDLESKNGTWVNGEKVKERTLQWGDRILVGPMELVFVPHEDGREEPKAPAEERPPQPKTLGLNVSNLDLSYVKKPRPAHLAAVHRAAEALADASDPETDARALLKILLEQFDASRGAVLLYGERGGLPVDSTVTEVASAQYGQNVDFREDILKLVKNTGRAFLQDEDFASVYAPILSEGKAAGTLYLDTFLKTTKLDEDDLWVLCAVALQFGRSMARRSPKVVAPRPAADALEPLVAESPRMRHVAALVARAAQGDDPILLLGEAGTGKRLVAETIHRSSRFQSGPFVAVTCAGLAPDQMPQAIFGAEGGGPPSAFERARQGTLFLDQVAALDLLLQLKLVSSMKEGAARMIVASPEPLEPLVSAGQFREDLLQRVKGFEIPIPPLRERLEDLPLLAEQFVKQFAARFGKRLTGIEPAALDALRNFSWPGNVRQLRNFLERAVLFTRHSKIALDDIVRL